MREMQMSAHAETLEKLHCVICGQPADTMVDGEPSCKEHIELVYENQVEDYTADHLKKNEYLEP